jgi:hypothetical protein
VARDAAGGVGGAEEERGGQAYRDAYGGVASELGWYSDTHPYLCDA